MSPIQPDPVPPLIGGDPASPFVRMRQVLARRQRRVLAFPTLAPAAVLVPIFEADGDLHVLFTLRTDTVKHHKGQVSFPGGARHDSDRDLLETALRESEEEIGLQRRHVEVLGALDDMITISYFQVTPWLARIDWPLDLIGSEQETAEIFTVPVERLLDPALCRLEEREVAGERFYPVYHFCGGKHVVWGITGHIVAHFLELAFDWRHPGLEPERVNLYFKR